MMKLVQIGKGVAHCIASTPHRPIWARQIGLCLALTLYSSSHGWMMLMPL
jgi:hypothetical protein